MLIYVYNLIFILLVGFLLLGLYKSKLTKKLYFFIIVAQLTLISGLRGYSVGWDTNNYIWYFYTHSKMTLKEVFSSDVTVERGYIFLEYLVSKISNEPIILFFIIALFYMIAAGRLIYKNSSDSLMSFILFVCLGFYTFSMTGLRQTVALGFIFFGIEFIKKRKLLPFLIIVLVASTFHKSALVFLPAYFIAYKKFTVPYILFALLIIPTVYIFKDSIFVLLSDASGYDYGFHESEGPITLISLMIAVFLGGVIQIKGVLKRDKNNLIYYNFAFVSILLATLAFINPAALRTAYYYHIFLILFIPEIILSISDKKLRTMIYCASLVLVILLYIRNLTPASPFVPYQFFWQ